MSTMASRLIRSPKLIVRAIRTSLKTVHGVTPELRPRLPSRERSVPLKLARQGSWKTPLGENFDDTGVVQLGFTNVFGLPVNEDSCRLSPLPVRMLNGRPELKSISGAKVQSLSSLPAKPLPPTLPPWKTPLKTKR